MENMKILVVYYSRTGTTKKVAEFLDEAYDFEVEAIEDYVNRSGMLGLLRSTTAAMLRRGARIAEMKRDPRDYDLVVIGTPIWAGTMSTPVRSFLQTYGRQLHSVAFFCTHGDGKAEPLFSEMTSMCGKKPVSVCAIAGREVQSGLFQGRAAAFLHELQHRAARARKRVGSITGAITGYRRHKPDEVIAIARVPAPSPARQTWRTGSKSARGLVLARSRFAEIARKTRRAAQQAQGRRAGYAA